MEPDFYDLSLAKFLQGSPELGNLIVTFKDVSEELQDNVDIKVGVFVLRSGEEIFYVPVVSKSDNVYPIDSIFFNSKKKFFPLTKRTIALVINSSQLSQGKSRKIPSTVVTNPDLTQLINPPRTGKYVAASTSRIGDFMASMPDYLKTFTMEKISQERSVYENLHKMFSIADIFAALKTPQSMAARTNGCPVSIVTGASTNLSPEEIASILENGYHVRGTLESTRVAIPAQNFEDGKFTQIVELDGNSDYEVMFKHGNSREAFIPKVIGVGTDRGTVNKTRETVALFTNGDFAISESIVAKGTKLDRKNVLDTIFDYNPPVLPRDVNVGDKFAIIDSNAGLVGIFSADKVMLNHVGVEISAYALTGVKGHHSIRINALRDYGSAPSMVGHDMYVPYSTLVLKLGENISFELERSVDSAHKKFEITQAGMLGDQLNLAFDGVEFSVNGKPVGQEKQAMARLVIDEGIDPELAKSFVKQAKDQKITRIYLSKQASTAFQAGEIPQFGNPPPPQDTVGLNGSFIPSVQQSLSISDAQSTEATIISELLQAPDMFELISEYAPDIEECIDRLGRILFLSRVNISQLSENNDSDGVFAFLSSLKNVYRMLGDNFIKLQELVALRPIQQ